MKRKLRLAFEQLEKEMEVIPKKVMHTFKGGTSTGLQPPSWDCVFNVFDYLDDHSMNGYYYTKFGNSPNPSPSSGNGYSGMIDYGASTFENLFGYNPILEGGVKTSDISSIGFAGGMAVYDYGSSVSITANGTTPTGESIMMLIPGANGNHAVIVTGTTNIDGITHLTYFDLTLNKHLSIPNGDAVGFYGVSKIVPNVPNY